ncbi:MULTISPECIES: hypothetical protein [Mycobacteroides]|uniref:hypothetical protein n=1 Tax=unclassified Mycobacteroides TaxID=2618759 RepID=UPI001F0A3E81|nr:MULTISPECIES: hypothetical protein [Mycobacteroides]
MPNTNGTANCNMAVKGAIDAGQHFGLVDVVDAQALNVLRLHEATAMRALSNPGSSTRR